MDSHVSALLRQLPPHILVDIIESLSNETGVEVKYGREPSKTSTQPGDPCILASGTNGTATLTTFLPGEMPKPQVFTVTCLARVEQQLTFKVHAHTPEEAIEFAVNRHGADGKMICEDSCEHVETLEETCWEAEL